MTIELLCLVALYLLTLLMLYGFFLYRERKRKKKNLGRTRWYITRVRIPVREKYSWLKTVYRRRRLIILPLLTVAFLYFKTHFFDYLIVYYGQKDQHNAISFLGNTYAAESFCMACTDTLDTLGNDSGRFRITGYTKTAFRVNKGDLISLEPVQTSKLYAGNFLTFFLGGFDCRGRESGILSVPLDDYNLIRKYPHAALMYKISGAKEWTIINSGLSFISRSEGYLEFEINDRILEDNRFHFCVKVEQNDNFSDGL